MKQKRKVKNLNPNIQAYKKNGIKIGLILTGCIFSLCAISLLSSTAGAAGGNNGLEGISYTGFDDKIEVLYKVGMTTGNVKEKDEIYINNSITYITPGKVNVNDEYNIKNKFGGNEIEESKYGNIIGGDHNEIKSDNVTMVAGSGNIVNINNENSTILGGEYNRIKDSHDSKETPSVIIGGINNLIDNIQNGVVILGGNGNINSKIKSFILGGAGNEINNENVIVGGINNKIGQENIFSFSNTDNQFTPKQNGTFYLNLQGGLGINTRSSKGVASKGAISFGEIDIDNLGCNGGIYGLQGSMEGCLVGCTENGWDLMDFSDYCISICNEHSSCNFQKNEKNINGAKSSCTYINTENATLCAGNIYESYNNSIFQSSYIDSTSECPGEENKCVYKCKPDSRLLEDTTGKHGETRCFKSCELPWSEESIIHGTKVTGYKKNEYTCTENCNQYKAELICDNGVLYLYDDLYKNGGKEDKTKNTEYIYETCATLNFECDSSDYTLTRNDRNNDKENRKRGSYGTCTDYKATQEHECLIDESRAENGEHYKLLGCGDGYEKYEYGNSKSKCMGICEGSTYKMGHTETLTFYTGTEATCPNTLKGIERKCNDGKLEGDTNYQEPYYNYTLYGYECDKEYKYSETEINKETTNYYECISYKANDDNTCSPNETRYKFKECKDKTNYHQEDAKCVSNTKQENCKAGTIANGSYTVEQVDVTRDTELKKWNDTPSCTKFTCNTGYEPKDGGCVQKTTSEG